MIWIAKLLYAALKWFTLVALITGIMMETWLSRKRIYFMFDCSILSKGWVYYTLHWLMEKHTVLHYDVHLRAELCVASAQSGIRPRPACKCVRKRKNWFPLTKLNWGIWRVEHVPQQLEVFFYSWMPAVFFCICFTEPLNAKKELPCFTVNA